MYTCSVKKLMVPMILFNNEVLVVGHSCSAVVTLYHHLSDLSGAHISSISAVPHSFIEESLFLPCMITNPNKAWGCTEMFSISLCTVCS